MNAKNLESLLDVIIRKQIKKSTLYVWGSSGCGKTTLVRAVARKYGMDCLAFGCESITDPGDLRGGIVNVMCSLPDGSKGYVMQYSIPELVRRLHEKPAILLFDELPRTPPQSQNAIMSVFTEERRLGMWKLPDHTAIIAAGNPSGGDGTYFGNEMDFAQVERFVHVAYAPSREEVLSYLSDEDRVGEGILSYFAQVSEALYAPLLPVPYKVKATPRSIEALGELINAMSREEYETLGLEIAEGLMGEHANGIIQSINNSFEKPVAFEAIVDGSATEKLAQWVGNSVKVGLLNASLRNFSKGVKDNHPVWKNLTAKCTKNPALLEPLAGALVNFPIDLLRRYIKELSENGNIVIAHMVKYGEDAAASKDKFPNCHAFVSRMQALKAAEERLQRDLKSLLNKGDN